MDALEHWQQTVCSLESATVAIRYIIFLVITVPQWTRFSCHMTSYLSFSVTCPLLVLDTIIYWHTDSFQKGIKYRIEAFLYFRPIQLHLIQLPFAIIKYLFPVIFSRWQKNLSRVPVELAVYRPGLDASALRI